VDFESGFLADPDNIDIQACRWAYKAQREIARRRGLYRGEVESAHPPFPPTSNAACIQVNETLSEDVQDIVYTAEDDALIDQFVRERVETTWHSLGTCKMAPLDQMGVVDANLNVYGVPGLRIADISIAPGNVGAHPNNAALTIGERAASIFIQALTLG
jgi:alcohol oxidase